MGTISIPAVLETNILAQIRSMVYHIWLLEAPTRLTAARSTEKQKNIVDLLMIIQLVTNRFKLEY